MKRSWRVIAGCTVAMSAVLWSLPTQGQDRYQLLPAQPPVAMTAYQEQSQMQQEPGAIPHPEDEGGPIVDGIGDCCICCEPSWHMTYGVEATYLYPEFDDADLSFSDGAIVASGSGLADLDFATAPRVWLGAESCTGNGVRMRYWEMESSDSHSDIFLVPVGAPPIPLPVSLHATTEFETYTFDLEYTRRFCRPCGEVLGFFGVRHAAIEKTDTFDAVSAPTAVTAAMLSARRFEGTGLTFGLEGYRPIGCCNLSFVWSARGSVLFGDNQARVSSLLTDPTAIALQLVLTEEKNIETYIFEMQAGVQWMYPIECLGVNMFARTVFEYQHWNSDELDFIAAQLLNGATTVATPRVLDSVDFYGIGFSAGVTW